MMKAFIRASTGVADFDDVIDSLRMGDNVVWQVDDIEDYAYFVAFFVDRALSEGKKVNYMRFAEHRELVRSDAGIITHQLEACSGFEPFSAQVHAIATEQGQGAYYVFDSLSDLLSAWATDLMIGNFFTVTCPYLFQLNTIAYFGLLRNSHSFKTVARIRETTQVLLDIYNNRGDLYVHPLKVKGRHSHTMFLPHKRTGDGYIPVTSSVDASRLLTYISSRETEQARRNLDYWDRLFLDVEMLLQKEDDMEERGLVLDHLCQIMIGREKRILDLARKNFSLDDLLAIKSRLIGTGYIGGKAAGMLISRKILQKDYTFDWAHSLEPHDSFFIGSDVFYTYIVENGWWKLWLQQKTEEGYFEVARVLQDQMLEGTFPDEIEEQFWRVIEYFGQSPIIVRSSSLLEDAFGNAFAGKYESVFCVNQGAADQRYQAFTDCVRRIFASTMNEDALTYRLQRGLSQHDEQMALLVQRVSGSYRGRYFFPDIAGVGISYNTFVWKKGMDPNAGTLRLVVGLGTRAVNRVDHDYPRIVALDLPLLKPHAGLGDTRKYSQHEVDILDVEQNCIETVSIAAIDQSAAAPAVLDLVSVRDNQAEGEMRRGPGTGHETRIVTFDKLLAESPFSTTMQRMLKKLEAAYKYPVDIEFTANFTSNGSFQINLLQCRPLQTKGEGKMITMPDRVEPDDILFRSDGNFMGGSVAQCIRRVIYVDPQGYTNLSVTEKYDIARLIGKLNRQIGDSESTPTLLMGPGRWGTTTPSLGVPVRFSEINHLRAIVEIEYEGGSLVPEISFGTHFFQDLVETDIFYVALFVGKAHATFNREWLKRYENRLASMIPERAKYEKVVWVLDVGERTLYLMADVVAQTVICFGPGEC